ncbi:hypothetical protein OIU77_018735 [Salix suchowensis]|uniref:Uncharacterized protein n=1 Tax=Salix suchowensis TaxID=1278906 RepID=A0ABQ9CFM5_9ROSI|nr:hypothetical protein OIU77_018735 [Salix suchowensis]
MRPYINTKQPLIFLIHTKALFNCKSHHISSPIMVN